MRTVIASTAGLLALGNAITVEAAAGDYNAAITYTASACTAGSAKYLGAEPTASGVACSTAACGGTSAETKCLTSATYGTFLSTEFGSKAVFMSNTFAAPTGSTLACSGSPTKYEIIAGDDTCIKIGSTSAKYALSTDTKTVTKSFWSGSDACPSGTTPVVTKYTTSPSTATDICEDDKLNTFKNGATTYKLTEVITSKATFTYSGTSTACAAGTALKMSLLPGACAPAAGATPNDELACAANVKPLCADTTASYATVRDAQFGDRSVLIKTTYEAVGCSVIDGIEAFVADGACIKNSDSSSEKYVIAADGKTVTKSTFKDGTCTAATDSTPTTSLPVDGACPAAGSAAFVKYSIKLKSTPPPTGGAQIAASTPAAALLAVFSLAMAL